MRTDLRRVVCSLLFTIAFANAAADAATAVATKWRLIGESQADCMGHARMAIANAGYDVSPAASQSMSGKRGDYTASIRCVTEQKLVFFVVAGPLPDVTSRYIDELYSRF
jgi:hypothetical protein